MSRFRCYIQPFDDLGAYSGVWHDITDDVDFDGMGKLSRKVDANDYDVGVFKFTSFNVTLFNSSGRYADPSVFQSLFRYKVANTLFKITWDANDYYCRAGMCKAGAITLFSETEIFRGFVDDTPAQMDIDTQKIQLSVLGYESIFEQVLNPGTLLNGDIFSALIYKLLNQTEITDLMTLSIGNINLGIDGYTVDDVTQYDNQTVNDILNKLLFLSNSVLYVNLGVIYIVPRNGSGSSQFTFRGQASTDGIENILNINNLNTGANKMFNFWTWEDATPTSIDNASVTAHGYSRKQVNSVPEILVSNTTLIQVLLDAYVAQFKDLKQEFDLMTPVKADTFDLFLMDHVTVDYPTVVVSADSNPIPLYGVAIYGDARYPISQWQLTIPITDDYQITGWAVDIKNQNFIFTLKKFN